MRKKEEMREVREKFVKRERDGETDRQIDRETDRLISRSEKEEVAD